MITMQVPAGYTVGPRERVTWTRWDAARRRNAISHPYQVQVTEPDGYVRSFDSHAAAMAWLADPDNTGAE